MELEETPAPVDPEVRAYVCSLVSALGGTGTDEDGRYVLGDDALACLKDLKRWLKLYDEKANRLDVARCLAEANLVEGDLLEILGAWPEEATGDRVKAKIALACLELLVPLTWPIEKSDTQLTVNHHRHIPYIQLAQTSYKRAMLESQSKTILRTAVRIGLPSIAIPMSHRTARDEGIIKIIVYLFRNLSIISTSGEGKEGPTSRSATIEAFHHQDVLALILTICSNIGEDFNTQDVVILELLFHLLKGVNVETLFMDESQLKKNGSNELGALLAKEKNMHRSYAKHAPSRHNRFGTMIWVKRDEPGHVSTVSGQYGLTDKQHTFSKMDQSKRWNKPKQRTRDVEKANNRFDVPVSLTNNATTHLRSFVEEFLDSSFNPLFNHIRRAIEREADRVLELHTSQFFYLISWFLEAERVRRRKKQEAEKKKKNNKIAETFEADSFSLIANVLTQGTLVLLNRFMQDRLDMKVWYDLNAGTRCFTQILLIIQDMAGSSLEEDQEIAENIQNRIFYEETTHDRILAILRGYKDQGFGYLDSCTELSHVFLRMLERYSRENVDLQVRSKRRARKQKKAAAVRRGDADADDDAESEVNDVAEAERVSKERKFDFNRFALKFTTQACIDSFVKFLKFYNDLSTEQLKRAHRFFYRVAFKQEISLMLFRIDYFALFYRIIKGPDPLDRASPVYAEWEELVRQLVKRMTRKLKERPVLAVEMLFSKIPSTVFFLENGYEKQMVSSRPRAPATLEVKGAMTREEQIGVAVAVLYEQQHDAVDWVMKVVSTAASERQSWEAASATSRAENDSITENDEQEPKAPSIVVHPDTEERRIAIFKDAKLRLLMTLSGFERLGIDDEPNATWIIPSSLSARQLHETHEAIQKHSVNPTMEYGAEDPIPAEEMLRRKPTASARRAEYDDDSEGNGIVSDGDDDFLFPAGGPTNTGPLTAAAALERLKKKRRKRRTSTASDDGGVGALDDETLERRREAREAADLEKRKKIKSDEFIYDSEDDVEADRIFFEKEESRRKGQAKKVMEVLRAGMVDRKKKRKSDDEDDEVKQKSKKKQRIVQSESESEDDGDLQFPGGSSAPRIQELELGSQSGEEEDTPPSTALEDAPQEKILRDISSNVQATENDGMSSKSSFPAATGGEVDDEDDEDEPVLLPSRRRQRAALMFESDSE